MRNADAFCMMLAAILDPLANRKSAIYLHGPKNSGKSQIQAVISAMCGGAVALLSSVDCKSSFWKEALLAKRVLFLPESDADFLTTMEFKSITGDDLHNINPKGRPMFKARIAPLLFFISNEKPIVPNDEAVLERIIDCEIAAVPLDPNGLISPHQYQKNLEIELEDFLGYCNAKYAPYRGGKRIPRDSHSLRELVSQGDREAVDIFEQYYFADPHAEISRCDVYSHLRTVIPGMNMKRYSQIIDFWKANYTIVEKRVSVKNHMGKTTRPWIFMGMAQAQAAALKDSSIRKRWQ